jgi:hypothetical protein
MFVTKSEYEKLQRDRDAVVNRWNALVARINKLGSEKFLKHASIAPPQQLDAEDVRRLIMLCHPDKHDGKQSATEMTQKLLRLKESMR